MNAGDQLCPETTPCPHPSSGGRKPTRTLAGKVDGTDVLRGNVESQPRHAAQLYTHANPYVERLVGSIRRECFTDTFEPRVICRDADEVFGSHRQRRAPTCAEQAVAPRGRSRK